MMIKRLFLLLTPILLIVGLFPSTAFATSDYDDVVSNVTSLKVGDLDVTTNYMSYITGTAAAYNQCDSTCKDYINTTIGSGSGWYIAQTYSGSPLSTSSACMRFTQDTSVHLTFQSNSSYRYLAWGSAPSSSYSVCLYPDGSGGVNTIYDSSNAARFNISAGVNDVRPLLSTVPVDYPTGYAGQALVSSLTPNKHYSPRASYSVKGQHVDGLWCVAATSLCNLPPGVPVNLVWHIEDSSGETIYTPDHASNFQNDGGLFKYDFPGLGKFYLVGVWSAPIPYIQPSDQTWDTTRLPIDINGGNYVSGTYGQGCDNGGTCSDPFVYEDCTTYGTDLIGGFNCIVNNFKTWLTITADTLFVPTYESMMSMQDDFNSWAAIHLGALIQFSTWFNSLISDSTSGATDVVCNHDFGTFFGSHFVFNQCVLEQKYPSIWGVVSLVARSTLVFMVLLMVYQKIRYIIGASERGN